MNILLLASHGIAEYDDIRMFARLGYDVFCPGGYSDPAHPGETLRPAIPEAPDHPELRALCDIAREKHAGEDAAFAIDWAKADLHPDLIDWADVIIAHHFVDRWLGGQWDRIRHKRVIWRTCGQSNPGLEQYMATLKGLQIVRYSPAERRYFESIGAFAGEDALIRFGKYPDDYGPWIGDGVFWADDIAEMTTFPFVGNVTQNMIERGDATGLSFYLSATQGLPAKPAGPGSERLPGGVGALDYDAMREYLRRIRVYLYTGTTPASYTLGLIEAALSGVPIVSIPASAWAGPPTLFEGHELASDGYKDTPPAPPYERDPAQWARRILRQYLNDPDRALASGHLTRQRAIDTFGMDTIGPQWVAFLGRRDTTPWAPTIAPDRLAQMRAAR